MPQVPFTINPQAPPTLNLKTITVDGPAGRLKVQVPQNFTPEDVDRAYEFAMASAPQKPSVRQEAGQNMGGLLGGIGGGLLGSLGGPLGTAAGSVGGSALGGALMNAITGHPAGPAMGAASEALWSLPGEIVAGARLPLHTAGRALDRTAFHIPDAAAKDIRVPGLPHPNPKQLQEYVYTEARKRADIGNPGRQRSLDANRRAIDRNTFRMDAMVEGSPVHIDPALIAAKASQHAMDNSHAIGNYTSMQEAADRATAAMKADPLLGMDVTRADFPPGINPDAIRSELPTVTTREFKPGIPVKDAQTVKRQTADRVDFRRKTGGGATADPNLDTIQKGGVRAIDEGLSGRDIFGDLIPGYKALNDDSSFRIPLEQVLEQSHHDSFKAPSVREYGGLASILGASFLGSPLVGGAVGTTMALKRPIVASAVGQGMMGGASMAPTVGRGFVNPLARLVNFLTAKKEGE